MEGEADQALAVWKQQIDAAYSTFEASLKSAGRKEGYGAAVAALNAQITFMRALAAANETLGHGFTQNDVRSLTIETWQEMLAVGERGVAIDRIVAVQMAYKEKVQIPNMGTKDGAMEQALAFAALMETQPEDVEKIIAKIKIMLDAGEHLTTQSAIEALPESERKALGNFCFSYVSERETETIRKSIQRARKSMGNKLFVKLDPDSLQFSLQTGADAFFQDLPSKQGRPKKS